MTDRLLSGTRLDQVLGGGLPGNAINLIAGVPGTGKTVLAHQYVFRNASPDHGCAIYYSTAAEPYDKLVRFGQTLTLFEPAAIGQTVFYEDMQQTLVDEGLEGTLELIDRDLRERRPAIIVIDSFKALRAFRQDDAEMQRYVHRLASRLSAFPVAAFWLGEYTMDEIAEAPEFAVADSVLSLSTAVAGFRESRFLRVLKLRGSSYLSGVHAYRISADGLQVFPRLADPADSVAYGLEGERQSSGIAFLDQMLMEGYFPGSATLVAGPSGAGKTVMGLHFVLHGALNGEPGVIATFEENPSQLERMAQGFGWSLTEGIELMYRSLVDIYVDEWVYDLLETVERIGARRILVDGVSSLKLASPDEVRFLEYVYSLTQRCSRLGVSVMMTMELADLFQVTRLTDAGISRIYDNVLLLSHSPVGSSMSRSVTVLKTRSSRHDDRVRDFIITSSGMVLQEQVVPELEIERP
ncbi:MAG: RAD55 family ATPase [Gaiellaceae bacterium]